MNPDIWNVTKQRLKGNSKTANEINEWINSSLAKVALLYRGIELNGNIYLPSLLQDLFIKSKAEPSLLQVIKEHNQQLLLRVKNDFAYSTYEKYIFTYNKVKAFIEVMLKRDDILLREITTKFIMDFDHYLRVQDKNQHNTAVKYCLNLKRVLNVAVLQGMIPINP